MPQPAGSAEHLQRVERLQEALRSRRLAGALLLDGVGIYYLAGTRQSGALFVPASAPPLLLVRRSLERARAESRVTEVRPFPPSRQLAAALAARGKVGADFEIVPAALIDWWRRRLPGAELVDLGGVLREQRSVKSPGEIEEMRTGAARLCAVLAQVPAFLSPGMREVDLAAEIEYRLRRAGNEGSPRLHGFGAEFFLGLAVGGESAAEPGCFDGPVAGRGLHPAYPTGASERPIGPGEPVLLDYTAVCGGYVVDMSRVAVLGALDPEMERAFDVALAIQEELAGALVPGEIPENLWRLALERASAAGLGEHFMGPPGNQARFVGHGVGLQLDELPVLAEGFRHPLAAGQTVAMEPKFVFPRLGAVGIENTWVVTARGGEKLTKALPDAVMRV